MDWYGHVFPSLSFYQGYKKTSLHKIEMQITSLCVPSRFFKVSPTAWFTCPQRQLSRNGLPSAVPLQQAYLLVVAASALLLIPSFSRKCWKSTPGVGVWPSQQPYHCIALLPAVSSSLYETTSSGIPSRMERWKRKRQTLKLWIAVDYWNVQTMWVFEVRTLQLIKCQCLAWLNTLFGMHKIKKIAQSENFTGWTTLISV